MARTLVYVCVYVCEIMCVFVHVCVNVCALGPKGDYSVTNRFSHMNQIRHLSSVESVHLVSSFAGRFDLVLTNPLHPNQTWAIRRSSATTAAVFTPVQCLATIVLSKLILDG